MEKFFPLPMLERLSLRTLLIAGAVVMAAAFTVLVGVGATRAVHGLVVAASLERQELLAREIASEYEQFLRLHLAAVEAVAKAAAAAPRLDMANLYAVLERTNAAYDALWGIGITDERGRIVAVDPPETSEGVSAIGVDLSDRAWFRQMVDTRRSVVDGRVVIGRVKFTPTITVNAPILDAAGGFRGAVTGGLELGSVRELAERVRIGRTGQTNVASADAVLFATGATGGTTESVATLPVWSKMTGPSGRIAAYRDAEGRERLAGFAVVPLVGWRIWVSQELGEIGEAVRAAYTPVLVWLLAVLGGVVVCAVLMAMIVTRPLQGLRTSAAALAEGDLAGRAPERGPLEIAALARSFNRMAQALRARIDTEREDRARLEAALAAYGAFAARVARGDLAARVTPAGEGELAELGGDLNRMAAALEEHVTALREATAAADQARARVSDVLDRITDGFVAYDREWRIIYLNRTAEQFIGRLGRQRSEVVGQNVWEMFPELVGTPVEAAYRRALGEQLPVVIEQLYAPLQVWFELRIYPSPDGLSVYFADITERKRVARERDRLVSELAAEREALGRRLTDLGIIYRLTDTVSRATSMTEIYDEALDALRSALWVERASLLLLDEDGVMRFRAWRGLSDGYRRAVEGHSPWPPDVRDPRPVVVPDVETDPSLAGFREIIVAEGIRALAFVPLEHQGRLLGKFMLYYGAPHAFTEAELQLVQTIATQVAFAIERKRGENERGGLLARELAAREEAEAANRAKDEFLATLSHELRTPLQSMLGWVRLLRTHRLESETTARALESIERNTLMQAQLVEDLLDVSRIVAGKLTLDTRPVQLVSVIEAAVDAVRSAATQKAIRLGTRLDVTAEVQGDPARLEQVLWNLLSNAVKFTPEGGHVEVRLERADGRARVVVSDTGRGIHPEALPHIFERFSQADPQVTRTHRGLGLGLAIVRHLVRLHGGTVTAASEGEGRGATFTVELPLLQEASARPMPLAPGLTPLAPLASPAALADVSVLVVDDDADTCEVLELALARHGARVATANSVADALKTVEGARPDVVITDIAMPGADGYALVRHLAALARERRWRIPVVAISAHARGGDRDQALAAGFDAYLAKPIDPADLVTVVVRALAATAR